MDSTGYRTLKNPDTKIQNYMNYQYNIDKAIFEGLCPNSKDSKLINKKKIKVENQFKSEAENIVTKETKFILIFFFYKNEFKKLLRDQDLYVEIKSRLKNAYQFLNHSKLNGKSLKCKNKKNKISNSKLKFKFNKKAKMERFKLKNRIWKG